MTPMSNLTDEPAWTSTWACGNCGSPWPCGCDEPVRVCEACGEDAEDCRCDDWMTIYETPDWTEFDCDDGEP